MKILKGLRMVTTDLYPASPGVNINVVLEYEAPITVGPLVFIVARSTDLSQHPDLPLPVDFAHSSFHPESGLAQIVFGGTSADFSAIIGMRFVIDTMSQRLSWGDIKDENGDPVEDSLAAFSVIFTVGNYIDDDAGPF